MKESLNQKEMPHLKKPFNLTQLLQGQIVSTLIQDSLTLARLGDKVSVLFSKFFMSGLIITISCLSALFYLSSETLEKEVIADEIELSDLFLDPFGAENIEFLDRQVENISPTGGQANAIPFLESIIASAPDHAEVREQLAHWYYEQGLIWRDLGQLDRSRAALAQAVRLSPQVRQAQHELAWLDLYLIGLTAMQSAQWGPAIQSFEDLFILKPGYLETRKQLIEAYYQEGSRLQSLGHLSQALVAFEQALTLQPNSLKLAGKVAEVKLLLFPPTPTPEPIIKTIIVDVSDQRTYAYEGGQLVYQFISSTGEYGRDTAVGNFQILNKIPMAYASTWDLDMPYWMGVYRVGPLENGFHAPPTVRHTGITMWEGYIGQRISYGCVILTFADMKTLYDWAEVGVPVTIRY